MLSTLFLSLYISLSLSLRPYHISRIKTKLGHRVNSSVTEKLREEIENFYMFPEEENMRYKLWPGDVEGYGQTILHSATEKVDWADRFYMVPQFPVKLQPESFIINVGDVLEILSNGAFNSLEHRATVNAENSRISIAMFFNPKFEAYVGPSPSLVSEENPPKFRTILMEDYVKESFSRKLDGKTFRDIMKLEDNRAE